METPTYTALTIGPIYKTLSQARKTRELWGGSYLFSYIMRGLMEKLPDVSKCCLPYYDDILNKGTGNGAGLFPDRLIYEGDVKAKIESDGDTILQVIAMETGVPLDYLKNYIRIYALTYSLPQEVSTAENEAERKLENQNIVIVANKLLDTIELKEKHFKGDINNIDWSKAIDKINGKKFYGEAFLGKDKQFKFPSIVEIATSDFSIDNPTEYDEMVKAHLNNKDQKEEEEEKKDQSTFVKVLKADKDQEKKRKFKRVQFRPYHKYIVVVQADGDNIGATIGKIGANAATVRKFSSALFEFTLEAGERIKSYGGKAVYIGGDDLLFFAPVAVHNRNVEAPSLKSIFSLIEDIDKAFKKTVLESDNLKSLYQQGGVLADQPPSMSYGISITYSKYPLNEARDNAYALLNTAKEIKDDKNKICFKLHKHSGQGFGFTVDKKQSDNAVPKSYDHFLKLVNNIPLDKELLSSVIYKLAPLHVLLNKVVKLASGAEERLKDFFDQEFELENLRKKIKEDRISVEEKAKLEFLDSVRHYYYLLSKDFPGANNPLPEMETEQSDSNIVKLYSTLRFMKHLISEDE